MTTYNGWANWATWNANLWLDESGDSETLRSRALEVLTGPDRDDPDLARSAAADAVEAELDATLDFWAEASSGGAAAGFCADAINRAIAAVDRREIAWAIVDEVADEINYPRGEL